MKLLLISEYQFQTIRLISRKFLRNRKDDELGRKVRQNRERRLDKREHDARRDGFLTKRGEIIPSPGDQILVPVVR